MSAERRAWTIEYGVAPDTIADKLANASRDDRVTMSVGQFRVAVGLDSYGDRRRKPDIVEQPSETLPVGALAVDRHGYSSVYEVLTNPFRVDRYQLARNVLCVMVRITEGSQKDRVDQVLLSNLLPYNGHCTTVKMGPTGQARRQCVLPKRHAGSCVFDEEGAVQEIIRLRTLLTETREPVAWEVTKTDGTKHLRFDRPPANLPGVRRLRALDVIRVQAAQPAGDPS